MPAAPPVSLAPPVASSWLQWPTLAWGAFTAVRGESNYQAALWRACGSGADGPVQRVFLAQLEPEPTNQYDRHAVRVLLDGLLVGYLPREVAPEVQPMLMDWAKSGYAGTCRADVRGGTRDKPVLGIVLHAGSPFRPFVAGSPFLEGGESTNLPISEATREARQQVLARYGDSGRPRAALVVDSGAAEVGVFVDDLRIGTVSKDAGKRLAGLVQSAAAAGFAPEATATIRVNKQSLGARVLTL